MSDDPEAAHQRAAIQHMMRRLDGFARGLGLDQAATRLIVEKVFTDMPVHTDAPKPLHITQVRVTLRVLILPSDAAASE